MRILTVLKASTIIAALLAGGTALAIAQNGPATGDERPVAGGANGGGSAYGDLYRYYNYQYQPQRHSYAYHPSRRYRYWHY